jgi:hypothetical protein
VARPAQPSAKRVGVRAPTPAPPTSTSLRSTSTPAPGGRRRHPNGQFAPHPNPPPRTAGRRTTRRSSSWLGRTAKSGYRRSGAQGQVTSAGTLLWQIAGMTIGIALLTIFISSSRGTGAFGGLADGVVGGLQLLVSPIDPLGKGVLAKTVQKPPASSQPTVLPTAGRTMKAAAA